MIRERREITVQQPRETVFEFLNDEEKLSSWVNGIVSITPIGAIEEGLGARAKIVINVPTEMEFESTVTAWDPPRRFAWSVEMKEMASTQTYTLEDLGDRRTKILLEVEHQLKGFVMRCLSPLIRMTLKRERAKEMERLRTVLDALPQS